LSEQASSIPPPAPSTNAVVPSAKVRDVDGAGEADLAASVAPPAGAW